MDKPKIKFKFNDEWYQVDYSAYDSAEYIVLPFGVVIQPNGWFESYPPVMAGCREVETIFKGQAAEEVAKQLGNAVVAEPFDGGYV